MLHGSDTLQLKWNVSQAAVPNFILQQSTKSFLDHITEALVSMARVSLLKRLETLWDGLQVELKGSYSVERLHSYKQYAEETNYVRALSVIVCTPIPCLIAVLCTDCFKLPSISEGVHHSQRLWLRSAVVNFFISWTQLQRCHRFVSGLPETPVFDLCASWLVGFGTAGFSWGLALVIGYPLPFTMVMAAAGWWLIALPVVFIRFGNLIRANPEISRQMKLFGWSILLEMINGTIYPAYNIVFMSLGVKDQIAFSLLLPVMKIVSKNITRQLFRHKEDLIPEVVVFTIEIFHSLFLVIFMQNARSIGTTLVLMGVDFACSTLAIWEVQQILARNIERCAAAYAAKNEILLRVPSILGVAEHILKKNTAAAELSTIRLRTDQTRHFSLRKTQIKPAQPRSTNPNRPVFLPKNKVGDQRWAEPTLEYPSVSVIQGVKSQEARSFTLGWLHPVLTAEDQAFADSLSKQDQSLIVRDTLQLMHLTEFLLLIEFTEIIVPLVYAIYLTVAFRLPNRMYYPNLHYTTQEQLNQTVWHVMVYATLELLSLIVLSLVLQRKLRLSTIQHLAFVLEKNWKGIQSRLVFWVVYTVQGSLEHFGADFTFKFAWLQSSS